MLEKDIINSIRVLSADMVEEAGSGHPGTAIGAAPIIATLFQKFMKVSPENPAFFNRDRFVLSAGHTSAMLYSILHICGYDIKKSDLPTLRKEGGILPGHPEHGLTPGVDCSTGPLGQGIANAVGMALAEKVMASRYNQKDCTLVDHYTYAFCGDGCMMEGIENEAASLAGVWKLGKLIVFYDSNGITIEGTTDIAFTENVAKRHEALGWQTITVDSAEDTAAIEKAIKAAQAEKDKPSLIVVKSIIGYGTPKAGTSAIHGSPVGKEGIDKLKQNLGWTLPLFETPQSVKDFAKVKKLEGKNYEKLWKEQLETARKKYPEVYAEFLSCIDGSYKNANLSPLYEYDGGDKATRNICGEVLNKLDGILPNLIGGSADLSPSNCTAVRNKTYYSPSTPEGGAIHFGIREHAMAAICNGIALHGGLVPFCATFFTFSDYMKHAMRMSAIMKLPVIYILSHDSIGVGEDGMTHQPIEQLAALRSMPNMYAFRPSDNTETAAAYEYALTASAPVAIVTSRQKCTAHGLSTREGALKGGYVLKDSGKNPQLILITSGSETGLCLNAQQELLKQGIQSRVVSMPCTNLFDEQGEEYKHSVLPDNIRARIAVEAASNISWGKYVGLDGDYVCMNTFGASAPYDALFKKFGFTVENITEKALKLLKN
ncbi:MAG: transketolase [Clostridia bacterium]|nr:transketolase [Clostridia bacterium]